MLDVKKYADDTNIPYRYVPSVEKEKSVWTFLKVKRVILNLLTLLHMKQNIPQYVHYEMVQSLNLLKSQVIIIQRLQVLFLN